MMEKKVIGDIKETKGTIQMAREIKRNNVLATIGWFYNHEM